MTSRISKQLWIGTMASGVTTGPSPPAGKIWVVRSLILQNLTTGQRISAGLIQSGVFYALVDNASYTGTAFQVMTYIGYQVVLPAQALFMFGALGNVHSLFSGYEITP